MAISPQNKLWLGAAAIVVLILIGVAARRSNDSSLGTLQPPVSPTPQTSVVTVEITAPEPRTYQVPISDPMTVAALTQMLSEQQGIPIETKDYGPSLGLLIESIDGVKNDTAANKYWSFYLNNQLSPVGASTATVKPGDTLKWSYESPSGSQ